MTSGTIGSRLIEVDAQRFVGRERELAELEALLVETPAANIVLVHGPGGIGKSALLREVVRRAGARGWPSVVIEARDLPDGPRGLEAEIRAVGDVPHALVVFDSFEHAAPFAAYLRTHVLTHLPAGWVAVIASRVPDRSLWHGGWEHLSRELELGPLEPGDARECLRRHGVDDDSQADRLVAWAAGSPLALVLSARVASTWTPAEAAPDELIGPLVRRVIDDDVDESQLAVLATASIARVTTAALLRAVLPDCDPGAYDWLASRTFAEPLGNGVTLHALFAAALQEHVTRRRPELARELRRRIADYAYRQSLASGDPLSYDLASLVDDPTLRWGYGWDRSGRYQLDQLRGGDLAHLDVVVSDTDEPLWDIARRYVEHAPEFVVLVRDAAGAVAGFAVVASTRDELPFADDAVLVPRLADARHRAAPHDAIVWTVSTVLADESEVRPLLGFGGVLRAGIPNARYAYLPINRVNPAAVAFSESLGGRRIPELDYAIDGQCIECHVVDFGPGGILGLQRALVYGQLGLPAPDDDVEIDDEFVRSLLRDLSRADRLAASPLARGSTTAERAESVRTLVRVAIDRAFGSGAHDARLRQVLTAGYLERDGSHEAVASALHMSRAAYFRTAREAVDRLTRELRGMEFRQ